MGVKRDSVNRVTGLVRVNVHLPDSVRPGDKIMLVNVKENDISPDIIDPTADGFIQPDGANYGDAVFDAMQAGAEDNVIDAMK